MVFRNSFVWAGDCMTPRRRHVACRRVLKRHVYQCALLPCRLRLTPAIRVRAMYELTASKQSHTHAAKQKDIAVQNLYIFKLVFGTIICWFLCVREQTSQQKNEIVFIKVRYMCSTLIMRVSALNGRKGVLLRVRADRI